MKIIIILAFTSFAKRASCQYIVKGLIKDPALKSISSATVVARLTERSAVIAFSISDDRGYYELKLPNLFDSVFIVAGSLGFESCSLWLKKPENGASLEKPFILLPVVTVLGEIVLKAQGAGAKLSGDTITFQADAYRDKTEKVTEDILKKIPGIDVAKDGTISVNGKRIAKILIEGDDLFDKNYTLLSRNLSAVLIDKVQIIGNYADKPLLKGIVNSEEKVLNITLKNSGEKIVFGNMAIGAGNDNRYDMAANLICFYKRTKAYGFGNYNSIGKEPSADIDNNAEPDEGPGSSDVNEITENKIIDIVRSPPGDIDRKRMNFNQAKLGSLSFTSRLSDKIQIKGLVSLAVDRNELGQINNYQYRMPGPVINIKEYNRYRQMPLRSNGHLNFRYIPGKNEWLDYSFTAKNDEIKTNATMVSNNSLFINRGNDHSWLQRHKVNYIKRINENHVMVIDVLYARLHKQQNFDLQQDPSGELPFTGSTFHRLYQSLYTPVTLYSIALKNIFGAGNNNTSVEAGMVGKTQGIMSHLDSLNNLYEKQFISDTFRNQLSVRQVSYFVTVLNTKRLSGSLKLLSSLSGHFQNLTTENAGSLQEKRMQFLYVIPKVAVKYAKHNHNLSFTYAYNTVSPGVSDLYTGYILTDYRTFRRGSDLYRLKGALMGLLTYSYVDWSRQIMLYVNFVRINDRGILDNQYSLSGDYDVINRIAQITRQNNSAASFVLDNFIPFLSSSFKLKTNISRSDYQDKINSAAERTINFWNIYTQVSMRTALKGMLNFHAGAAIKYSASKVLESGQGSLFRNVVFQDFIALRIKVAKNWSGELNAEHYYFKAIREARKSYFFIDFSLHCDLPGNKFSFDLNGENLTDNKIFLNTSIDDFSTQMQQFELLPACLLLRVNYRF